MDNSLFIGLMSGTSVDGLDIAICEFIPKANGLDWKILKADTILYDKNWNAKLRNAHNLKGEDLIRLHHEYGVYLGSLVSAFLADSGISKKKIRVISSHGHTVFHQPENGFTFQLGHGASIAAESGLPVVCDFRVQDVVMGGQGAPLVPIGDQLLFAEYDFCLNIGGIANISLENNGQRVAWDICPANMVLNYLSQHLGKPYDDKGVIAAHGSIIPDLYDQLNELNYYSQAAPKTLGREWVEKEVFALLDNYKNPIADKLTTFTEHVAFQIIKVAEKYDGKRILVTGGGAYNDFLIERINKLSGVTVIVPDTQLINYKEALIFALLGYLKKANKHNILSSVTGAQKNHISGVEYKI